MPKAVQARNAAEVAERRNEAIQADLEKAAALEEEAKAAKEEAARAEEEKQGWDA